MMWIQKKKPLRLTDFPRVLCANHQQDDEDKVCFLTKVVFYV